MNLVGIDDKIWTVTATEDTYFEEKDDKGLGLVGLASRGRRDPISGRSFPQNIDDPSFSDPRRYFLVVLERWMEIVVKEFEFITGKLEETIEKG
jgi:hypothetical protein